MAVARAVFTELGYHAATFGIIATRANVSRAAIEYYFATKRGLWSEVVEETHALVFDEGLSWAACQPTLPGRLAAFLSVVTQAGSNDRSAGAFLVSSVLDAQRHRGLGGDEHESMTASRKFISWAVNDAIECDELVTAISASDLVEMLLAVTWGMGIFTSFVADCHDLPDVVHRFELLLADQLWIVSRPI